MYRIGSMIYSESGHVLYNDHFQGYQCEGDEKDFSEREISLDDMRIENGLVYYDGIVQILDSEDYGILKGNMVKRRYSNDDQIAVMLNKDSSPEDAERYEKMQSWRQWSGMVAKKIVEILSK